MWLIPASPFPSDRKLRNIHLAFPNFFPFSLLVSRTKLCFRLLLLRSTLLYSWSIVEHMLRQHVWAALILESCFVLPYSGDLVDLELYERADTTWLRSRHIKRAKHLTTRTTDPTLLSRVSCTSPSSIIWQQKTKPSYHSLLALDLISYLDRSSLIQFWSLNTTRTNSGSSSTEQRRLIRRKSTNHGPSQLHYRYNNNSPVRGFDSGRLWNILPANRFQPSRPKERKWERWRGWWLAPSFSVAEGKSRKRKFVTSFGEKEVLRSATVKNQHTYWFQRDTQSRRLWRTEEGGLKDLYDDIWRTVRLHYLASDMQATKPWVWIDSAFSVRDTRCTWLNTT